LSIEYYWNESNDTKMIMLVRSKVRKKLSYGCEIREYGFP
jgi:hypothetical protein